MHLLGHTQKHNGGGGFLWRLFTRHLDNQGGAAGNAEIIEWLTANLPGMFDSYSISNNDLECKIGWHEYAKDEQHPSGSGSFGAGFWATPESRSHSFSSGNSGIFKR